MVITLLILQKDISKYTVQVLMVVQNIVTTKAEMQESLVQNLKQPLVKIMNSKVGI